MALSERNELTDVSVDCCVVDEASGWTEMGATETNARRDRNSIDFGGTNAKRTNLLVSARVTDGAHMRNNRRP